MPTYDYKCKKCDHVWEEFASIKAPPTKKCPACKKNAAERQISAGAAILFKGSGFYLTDYRSDSYKKAAAADSAASSTPKSDSSTPKSESKPSSGKSES
jgi:putative FmdB family regulatory protein